MTQVAALGLFGGTFDPIHAAHLRMAQAFRTELQLDAVRLIPAGQPYHRQHGAHASPEQRLAMVQLAIAGLPGLYADAREVHRNKPAYTIDTLQEIRAEVGPDVALWWLIGGDSLASLHTWRRWEDLFALANIAVALRPGFDQTRLHPAVRTQWQQRQVTDFSNASPSGTMRPLALPPLDVSATEIRQRLRTGANVEHLLSTPVLGYIRQHRLYC
ncbi:MAG: nicotinate-nucleotide adenylyltransferase [Aquitalea sp.]|nr:nicotinate-nucleotide adenylyltransferase [Aquitalea sp.]